jgi:ABC-type amino acid transport substrate-binding protein
MRVHSAYLVSALGAMFAALCFAVALALPPTMVGPKADVPPKADASVEPGISDTVNRASKGDRLRVIVRPPDAAPFEVQAPDGPKPKSLEGCESAFGQMDHSSAARLAQSCMT